MSEAIEITSLGDVEPKMKLKGTIKQIQLAGAIVDIGIEECDALLHISQIRRRRVNNVRDVLEEGQKVTVWVRDVDRENARLDVTMIQPPELGWSELEAGQTYTGTVVRIEKFGVFVDIGAERPGLVHISEMAHGYINKPEDVASKGQEVEVKVIGVNNSKKQIDLSMKATTPEPATSTAVDTQQEPAEDLPTAMAVALQRALAESEAQEEADLQAQRESGKDNEQDDIIRRTLERHSKGS